MRSTQTAAATGHPGKMKRKVYEKELHKLQVELCHLQDWLKATGGQRIADRAVRRSGARGSELRHRTHADEPAILARRRGHDAHRDHNRCSLRPTAGRSAWFLGVLLLVVYLTFAMTLFLLPPKIP
jgi:hypothetical protein